MASSDCFHPRVLYRTTKPTALIISLLTILRAASAAPRTATVASFCSVPGAPRICVTTLPGDEDIDGDLRARVAGEISGRLGLSFVTEDGSRGDDSFSHSICVAPHPNPSGYAIGILAHPAEEGRGGNRRKKKTPRPPRKNTASAPFFVDFCPGNGDRLGRRLATASSDGGGPRELLAKAVRPFGRTILDLTAGLGRDAAVLAAKGAEAVFLAERDPVVHALLRDGLRRLDLAADAGGAPPGMERLRLLEVGDAADLCRKISDGRCTFGVLPDVCYLDPMFPRRTKSAAVKKDLQILHGLVGPGDVRLGEERDLLSAALALAGERVVVKRPKNCRPLGFSDVDEAAPPLGFPIRRPSYEVRGSTSRWDVYIMSS